jgi:hypothetical protein
MYARWFRQIARAAGIPDDVWNMDSRAGGATEADEAGAALGISRARSRTPRRPRRCATCGAGTPRRSAWSRICARPSARRDSDGTG